MKTKKSFFFTSRNKKYGFSEVKFMCSGAENEFFIIEDAEDAIIINSKLETFSRQGSFSESFWGL